MDATELAEARRRRLEALPPALRETADAWRSLCETPDEVARLERMLREDPAAWSRWHQEQRAEIDERAAIQAESDEPPSEPRPKLVISDQSRFGFEVGQLAQRGQWDAAQRLLDKMKPGPARTLPWQPIGLEALTTAPPPRRWFLRHPTHDWQSILTSSHGDGMLPLGKVGVLSAEGGAGKTIALVQLAICAITGRSWFGHFTIGAHAVGRRVLLVLAEEDEEERDRRVWEVARALELSEAERREVASKLVALALAGKPAALLERGIDGNLSETSTLAELRRHVRESTEEWSLIGLDPWSRLAGPDAETDNAAATRAVQALESLVDAPGRPTVIVASHSSKDARKNGTADTRGVTGLSDGVRWVGTLTVADDSVVFRQTKSNYSRPMPEARAVRLARSDRGVLRAVTEDDTADRAAELAAQHAAAVDDDVRRVVDALRREGGELTSIDAIVRCAAIKVPRGRAAVRVAMARGLIVRGGTSIAPKYLIGHPSDVPEGGGEKTPHTPRDVGTSLDAPPLDVPGSAGTSRDVEGRRVVDALRRVVW